MGFSEMLVRSLLEQVAKGAGSQAMKTIVDKLYQKEAENFDVLFKKVDELSVNEEKIFRSVIELTNKLDAVELNKTMKAITVAINYVDNATNNNNEGNRKVLRNFIGLESSPSGLSTSGPPLCEELCLAYVGLVPPYHKDKTINKNSPRLANYYIKNYVTYLINKDSVKGISFDEYVNDLTASIIHVLWYLVSITNKMKDARDKLKIWNNCITDEEYGRNSEWYNKSGLAGIISPWLLQVTLSENSAIYEMYSRIFIQRGGIITKLVTDPQCDNRVLRLGSPLQNQLNTQGRFEAVTKPFNIDNKDPIQDILQDFWMILSDADDENINNHYVTITPSRLQFAPNRTRYSLGIYTYQTTMPDLLYNVKDMPTDIWRSMFKEFQTCLGIEPKKTQEQNASLWEVRMRWINDKLSFLFVNARNGKALSGNHHINSFDNEQLYAKFYPDFNIASQRWYLKREPMSNIINSHSNIYEGEGALSWNKKFALVLRRDLGLTLCRTSDGYVIWNKAPRENVGTGMIWARVENNGTIQVNKHPDFIGMNRLNEGYDSHLVLGDDGSLKLIRNDGSATTVIVSSEWVERALENSYGNTAFDEKSKNLTTTHVP